MTWGKDFRQTKVGHNLLDVTELMVIQINS